MPGARGSRPLGRDGKMMQLHQLHFMSQDPRARLRCEGDDAQHDHRRLRGNKEPTAAQVRLEPSIIYEDNKACISISEGDTDKKRTKHIAKHFHFVKEKRAAGLVVLKYLATALQVADMFTKQIFPKHFERLRRVMMGHENFDDMCERYQDAKAAGDDVDDPKIYTVKPERNSNG